MKRLDVKDDRKRPALMNHLTWHERLLIVAGVLLILVGAIARYSRALRDAPDTPGSGGMPITEQHAQGTRTD